MKSHHNIYESTVIYYALVFGFIVTPEGAELLGFEHH
jgi:hypothetical protein